MHSDKPNQPTSYLMASDAHFYGIPQHRVARNAPKKGIFVGFAVSSQISVSHFSPKFPPHHQLGASTYSCDLPQHLRFAALPFSQTELICTHIGSFMMSLFVMRGKKSTLERNRLVYLAAGNIGKWPAKLSHHVQFCPILTDCPKPEPFSLAFKYWLAAH